MSKQSAAWKKKRAELLERDGHRCSSCGDDDRRLDVHHRYYEAGKKAWDYPSETMDILCPRCHGKADEARRRIVRATGYLSGHEAGQAIGYMHALAALDQWLRCDSNVWIALLSYEHAEGVGDAFWLTSEEAQSIGGKRQGAYVAEFLTASRVPTHAIYLKNGPQQQ